MNAPTSQVLSDVEITGSVKFTGGLIFEGKLRSGLIEGDRLVVSEGAEIYGNIVVDNLINLGRIAGDVAVLDRCQLRQGAELLGNLKTARLVMEEGTIFTGGMEIAQVRGDEVEE